jgi:MFS family permease
MTNVTTASGFATFIFASTFYIMILGIIFAGSGFGIALSLYRSVITQLAPSNYRAGVVSISESGGQIVATLTTIIMGGIISVATPVVGLASSVRLAGVASLFISIGGGMVCLYLAKYDNHMNDTY